MSERQIHYDYCLGEVAMKTSTAYTSHILNKRLVIGVGILSLCIMLLLAGCGNSSKDYAYEQLYDLVDSFETELKKDFPYVKEFDHHSIRVAPYIDWVCDISEEKAVDELSELIARIKEFVLCDDLSEAMENTGAYYSKYTVDIYIVIKTEEGVIYEAVTDYGERDFVWSDEKTD
jgi:hypothetical protein